MGREEDMKGLYRIWCFLPCLCPGPLLFFLFSFLNHAEIKNIGKRAGWGEEDMNSVWDRTNVGHPGEDSTSIGIWDSRDIQPALHIFL